MTGRAPLIDPPTAGLVWGVVLMVGAYTLGLVWAKWRDAK